MELPDRIRSKIQPDPVTGCWIWMAFIHKGYGRVKWDGLQRPAHRVVYELLVGKVPSELEMDHLCRNRSCVNPDHLEPVTQRTNLLRGVGWGALNAAKTHCPHGHPFDEANTAWRPNGGRYCRECRRMSFRKWYERNRKGVKVA